MFKLDLEKTEETEIKLPTSTGSWKRKRVPEKKYLLLFYWLCKSLWLCGSQQIVKNSRNRNTRPSDLPLEKPVCRSGSNSWNWTWNNRLVPNREKSMSRLYIAPCLFNIYAEIDGETVETVPDFIFGAPKSLQMVIAAMKLKDAYSLEGKLWPT